MHKKKKQLKIILFKKKTSFTVLMNSEVGEGTEFI